MLHIRCCPGVRHVLPGVHAVKSCGIACMKTLFYKLVMA